MRFVSSVGYLPICMVCVKALGIFLEMQEVYDLNVVVLFHFASGADRLCDAVLFLWMARRSLTLAGRRLANAHSFSSELDSLFRCNGEHPVVHWRLQVSLLRS